MRPQTLWLVTACAAIAGSACDSVVDPVMEEGGFLSVAAGHEHSCALSAGGSAWCWGANVHGELSAWPERVTTGARFAAITAGAQHTCALAGDGRAFCWGSNGRGQLGTNSRVPLGLPQETTSQVSFSHIAAGYFHTCALTAAGLTYCWGAAGQGQTGSAAREDVLVPTLVPTPLRFAAITAGGSHSCALDAQGRAYCWGANDLGQLGDGTHADRAAPGAVAGGGTGYLAIAAGYRHTCAVSQAAPTVCGGSNERGELGVAGLAVAGSPGTLNPAPVFGQLRGAQITAGFQTSCAVASTRRALCWGYGASGQLGNGTYWDWLTPRTVSLGDLSGPPPLFTSLSAGLDHVCGVTTTHAIYCWGRGTAGQLGTGSFTNSTLAVRVAAAR
ncbi:MAG TPA: hypothetical protein VMN60_14565 [Longimicrobiales bacterium]|nr:hypothetical protein [Longimicrobiales bacterium]